MTIKHLLAEIEARLPELEWKMKSLGTAFSTKALPRGIFRQGISATACIAEIQSDLDALALQHSEYSAHYLAERLHTKINVLIALFHYNADKITDHHPSTFYVNKLATRQQWLQDLEKTIDELELQRQGLLKASQKMQLRQEPQSLLELQTELGKLERRITLAKEAFTKITK